MASPEGGLVFACIAPHGDLAIPEACAPEQAALARATQDGMAQLARRFDAVSPDVVVLLTPHGIHVDGRFAVVLAGRTAGSLAEAPAIALDLEVDRDLAQGIVDALRAGGVEYVLINFGGSIRNIRRFAREIMPAFADKPRDKQPKDGQAMAVAAK